MNKKIIAIYKQPGKKPEFMKIENSDEEFKRILGGDIEKLDLIEAYIVYLKNSENYRANVHIRTGTNSIGTTIKGHLLLVAKDKDSNKIKSLIKESAVSYGTYLTQRAYDYSNQAPDGHFYTKREMKAIEFMKKQKEEIEKIKKKEESQVKKEESNLLIQDEVVEPPQVSFKLKKEMPEEDKKQVYVDLEITNLLKAILFSLIEIRKEINSK